VIAKRATAPRIKPCRAIRLTADRTALVIRAWALSDRNFCTSTAAIPPTEIAEMLMKGRLPYSPNDVNEITEALNLIRVTVPAEQALSSDPFARLGTALAILSDDLPALIEMACNPPLGGQPKLPLARAFERLLSAVKEVDGHGVRNTPGRRSGKPWHDDAMWLAFRLRIAAARRGESDRVILTADTGNAVQFIRSALQRASRLTVTGDAIVKAIGRYAEGGIPGVTVSF
jgi:hypothetical protein